MGWLSKLKYSFSNIDKHPLGLSLDLEQKPVKHTLRYGSYGGFAGPWVRGIYQYDLEGTLTEWKIIFETVADPEGGAFDTVVTYDGTAVTFGIVQWTFTSGRLQKLLWEFNKNYYFHYVPIENLLKSFNLELKLKNNGMPSLFDVSKNKFIEDKALRNIFTPVSGKVPKQGKNWEIASDVVSKFALFGIYEINKKIQENYFYGELQQESSYKRPQLGQKTIAQILYPDGYSSQLLEPQKEQTALRALFWSMWQNNPREAEKYLNKTSKNFNIINKPREMMIHFARQVANSSFGYWGLEKCKVKGRTARYTKAAIVINRHMNNILPMKP